MGDEEKFAARLTPAERQVLIGRREPTTYRHGANIIRQGEVGDFVLFLSTGIVKVYTTHANGAVRIWGLRGAEELLGEIACVDGRPRTATVQVISKEASAIKISRTAFSHFLKSYPRTFFVLSRQEARWVRTSQERLERLDLCAVRRLLLVLEELCGLGWWPADERARTVALSQLELSQLAFMAEVSGQKALRDLRGRRLIITNRGSIVVPCVVCLRRAVHEDPSQPITGCGGGPQCPAA